MENVIIEGKKYPVDFSFRTLMKFEDKVGWIISSKIHQGAMSLRELTEISYHGILEGSKKEGRPLNDTQDFEWFVDVIDADQSILGKVMAIYARGQSKSIKASKEKKKKSR